MQKKDRLIVTCGNFDTINRYDLSFLQKARSKGDWLIVGVHSDLWMATFNDGFIQNHETRMEIVRSLKSVDEVFRFNDHDGTACQLLKLVKICYPNALITFISDSDMQDTPEKKIKGIKFEVMKQE